LLVRRPLIRITALCAGLLAGMLPLTAWARLEMGAPAGQADVTVGCMYPMTGRAAIYGRDSVAGMRLALADLAELPDSAAIPKLRIIVEEDRSKASFAVRVAQDFIRYDGVQVLCGMVSSGVARAVSAIARQQKIIMIGTDHASSRMTIDALHRYYFRVSNDSWQSNAAGARYLADLQKKNGWSRIAFIGPDYDYGRISWSDLRTNLQRLGVKYTLAGEFWPKLYEPDYATYIAALIESRPDIIVTALWGGDFIAFLKQAASSKILENVRLANFDTGGNYEVMAALGDAVPPGLILSARHHNNWPDTKENRRFVSAFHRAEGRYPTYAAEGAYSGVMAIAHAVALAGGIHDTDAMVQALEGLRLKLPEDPDGFVSSIDPNTHQIVQMQAIGEPVPNTDFPPARHMLGHWTVYPAEDLIPPPDVVRQRRRVPTPVPPLDEP